MKKAIILAGGDIANIDLVKSYYDEETSIICVDRGCDFAIDNSLDIEIAIGDFDSISKSKLKAIKSDDTKMLTFNSDKDKTDMQLAIEYCVEKEYDCLYLFGAIGTRMDHSMINISFLNRYKDDFIDFKIIDETNFLYATDKNQTIERHEGYYISFMIAEGNPIISVDGVKWPLKDYKMILGDSLTISNKITSSVAKLTVNNGSVLVLLSKD